MLALGDADIEDLRQNAGHADTRTTQRYNRKTLAKTNRVAALRVKARGGVKNTARTAYSNAEPLTP